MEGTGVEAMEFLDVEEGDRLFAGEVECSGVVEGMTPFV